MLLLDITCPPILTLQKMLENEKSQDSALLNYKVQLWHCQSWWAKHDEPMGQTKGNVLWCRNAKMQWICRSQNVLSNSGLLEQSVSILHVVCFCWKLLQMPAGWRLWHAEEIVGYAAFISMELITPRWLDSSYALCISSLVSVENVVTFPTGSTTRLTSEIIKNQLGAAALDRSDTNLCIPTHS